MTVEEIRGGVEFDEFPKGMRVLAVDDDPTCLKLLAGLLQKCQYHVTTANQARRALDMLRENRNRFDLIISDVHMPDMDGFKLLELVGLEMDLPVIMLSANNDPKLVMKGITHGACDYLAKPVRVEELRNIWQHVIRKKKVASKPSKKSNSHDKDQQGSDGGQATALTGIADQNGKLNRKRKDEEEEGDENDNEDDDPSTQKKPRVVWSIELHRKFVAAVNQLGLEKAVPKRILDLMNEEGLTRENVASHLQKYRLYLKRISSAASQQANMVAAFGKDASYLRMGSLDGLGDFRTLAGGSGRLLQNSGLSPYAPSGMLGRLNSPAGVNLVALNSSSVAQPTHSQSLSNPINAMEKFQPIVSPAHQNPNLFSGIQASLLELNQFQHSKSVSHVADFNPTDDHRNFMATNTFTDNRAAVSSSGNFLTNGPSNPFMLQGNTPQVHNGVGFVNQFSINNNSLNSESFNISASGSSNSLEDGRCHEHWQNNNTFRLTKFSSSPLPLSDPFSNAPMPFSNMISSNSPQSIHNQNSPTNFRSNSAISAPLEDSREFHGSMVGSLAPNLNQVNQLFRQHKPDYAHNSNNAFGTINSPTPGNAGLVPFSQSMDQINGVYNRRIDVPSVGRSNGSATTLVQIEDAEKLGTNMKLRTNEGYLLEQPKFQGDLLPNNCDPLDDLINAVMKREQDGTMLMGGDFGFDNYSFGSCI